MEKNTDHLEPNHVMIGAEGTEPIGAGPRSGEARPREVDEQLDAALACTFPASDPVGCLATEVNCASPGN